MAEISIIVPIYNLEQYLDKCLKSLIDQTYKDIEIICVDDCSTDASLKIAKSYAKKDKYKQEIFDLCQPFISENYNFNNTDKRTNKIIKNILYRQFMTYKKILGGLIYEYNDGIKHDFLLLKVLSLFKIKVSELDNKKKYYLLGIRMI